MAFFPNFLKTRYQLRKQAETRAPFPRDLIPHCKEILMFNQDFFSPYIFADGIDQTERNEIGNDAMYEIAVNGELRNTLRWICKKIFASIIEENWSTTDVYIRIFTSMLNKLVNRNIIPKEFSMYYHINLIKNVNDLRFEIMTEDLPF